ncbi:MAG TPA: ABC transporter ATP-binding protein, partial [Ilumatobacteraceae bacterium]|nr:ABC transporter ATP-binding protein [Ilumatobacteraceae bacterium]
MNNTAGAEAVLAIDDLAVGFPIGGRIVNVVESASLTVEQGAIVGLVGESGSGKTVSAMTAAGLLRALGGTVTRGSISFLGQDVTNLSERDWVRIRGRDIGVVFQNPTRTLNPAFRIGEQLAEVVRRHEGVSRSAAWKRAVEMLDRVGIADAERRARDYPHQFSGGMCQRVAIAMAIICHPKLLIADEPTTALDVTVQRHILDLLLELRRESGVSILLITHDLGVVAHTCDDVAVMYAGQVVERGKVHPLFASPQHPYTTGLLNALPNGSVGGLPTAIPGQVPAPTRMPTGCRFAPRCGHAEHRPSRTRRGARPVVVAVHQDSRPGEGVVVSLLEVEALRKTYPVRHAEPFIAVDDVSFTLEAGQTLALVGESGAGKSTTGSLVLRLIEPDSGSVRLQGRDVLALNREELRGFRQNMQMIFQDPQSSLDPRLSVGVSVSEPLKIHFGMNKVDRQRRAMELFAMVGLGRDTVRKFPHELSGGMLQRAAIARALTVSPHLLVCDEAVSALDVSVRAQVLNLLVELQNEL